MKMKKVLPLLMAAVMTTASLPMMANASDVSSQTESSTESSESAGGSSNSEKSSSELEAEDETSDTQDKNATEDDSENTKDTTDTTDAEAEDGTDETEVIEGDQVDTDNVVTLGENLTTEQRDAMYKYFGTSADKVRTIIVTHSDEVKDSESELRNKCNDRKYIDNSWYGEL